MKMSLIIETNCQVYKSDGIRWFESVTVTVTLH